MIDNLPSLQQPERPRNVFLSSRNIYEMLPTIIRRTAQQNVPYVYTNPYKAKRLWPPDFSKLSPKHQFRLERRYKRRAKLKWERPRWTKAVKMVQMGSVVCTYTLDDAVMIELTDWQLWVFMVCCSWIGIRRPGIRSPGRFKEYASVYVRGLWSVLTIYRFGTGSGE
jgi:hypothetical protein